MTVKRKRICRKHWLPELILDIMLKPLGSHVPKAF
jgi:hypothetical protein